MWTWNHVRGSVEQPHMGKTEHPHHVNRFLDDVRTNRRAQKNVILHVQVESVFGATRAVRGLQQFHHRGLEKNHHLWRFDLAVHNLMKKIIARLQAAISPTAPPETRRSGTDCTATPAGSAA